MSRFPSTNPYDYTLFPDFFYMETPNRLTKEHLIAKIKTVMYQESYGKLTICVLQLENGFTVTGESACVDPANFNQDIGRRYAYENAVEKMWPLEGYLLQEKLFQESKEPQFKGRIEVGSLVGYSTNGSRVQLRLQWTEKATESEFNRVIDEVNNMLNRGVPARDEPGMDPADMVSSGPIMGHAADPSEKANPMYSNQQMGAIGSPVNRAFAEALERAQEQTANPASLKEEGQKIERAYTQAAERETANIRDNDKSRKSKDYSCEKEGDKFCSSEHMHFNEEPVPAPNGGTASIADLSELTDEEIQARYKSLSIVAQFRGSNPGTHSDIKAFLQDVNTVYNWIYNLQPVPTP